MSLSPSSTPCQLCDPGYRTSSHSSSRSNHANLGVFGCLHEYNNTFYTGWLLSLKTSFQLLWHKTPFFLTFLHWSPLDEREPQEFSSLPVVGVLREVVMGSGSPFSAHGSPSQHARVAWSCLMFSPLMWQPFLCLKIGGF